MLNTKSSPSEGPLLGLFASAFEYMIDAGQRSVLFLDVMRQRGNQYREHLAETVPGAHHTVELALVDAGTGDQVLVHAGVALVTL